MAARKQTIPTPALVLGVGGLLPFIATAIATCLPSGIFDIADNRHGRAIVDVRQIAVMALGAYGAVILSFLGGIRWGKILNDKTRIKRWAPLALSVVPSLIAWVALLLTPAWLLSILAAGFVLQYALDIEAVKRGELPAWFGRLRTILTTGAVLSLLTGLLALTLLR